MSPNSRSISASQTSSYTTSCKKEEENDTKPKRAPKTLMLFGRQQKPRKGKTKGEAKRGPSNAHVRLNK
jgi:hypothetical protein